MPCPRLPGHGSAAIMFAGSLRFSRARKHADDVVDLLRRQRPTLGNMVPLGKASTAACGCGVLGHEDGMPPHGRLPAVVPGLGVSQPLDDKTPAVLQDYGEGLFAQIRRFLGTEPKAAAELALRQGRK